MTLQTSVKKTYTINADNNLVSKNKVTIKGQWELTDIYDLAYIVTGTESSYSGQKFVITGTLKESSSSSLTFQVDHRNPENEGWNNIITLTGVWKSDIFNQLTFQVKKENTEHDILTLKGTWKLSPTNKIIYTYEKATLITKESETHSLAFKGYWKVKNSSRLYYDLEGESESGFSLKVGFGKIEKRKLHYKVMIGATPTKERYSLNGSWQLSPKVGLRFDVDYEEGEVQPIEFGTTLKLTDKDKIELGFNPGISLGWSRKIMRNISSFLRFDYEESDDYDIKAGFKISF